LLAPNVSRTGASAVVQLLSSELLTGSSMKRPDPTRQSLRLPVSPGVRQTFAKRVAREVVDKRLKSPHRSLNDLVFTCQVVHADGSRTLYRIKFGPRRPGTFFSYASLRLH
jgi:hypothetical protein